MDTLWRLAWALPVVLLTGVASMVLLKKIAPARGSAPLRQRMILCESLNFTSETRVHLIEVDGQPHVLVESAAGILLQPTAASRAHHAAQTRVDAPPSWAQRLLKSVVR